MRLVVPVLLLSVGLCSQTAHAAPPEDRAARRAARAVRVLDGAKLSKEKRARAVKVVEEIARDRAAALARVDKSRVALQAAIDKGAAPRLVDSRLTEYHHALTQKHNVDALELEKLRRVLGPVPAARILMIHTASKKDPAARAARKKEREKRKAERKARR